MRRSFHQQLQGLAARRLPGLDNFVPACVDCHFGLKLPTTFSQPGNNDLAEPCTHSLSLLPLPSSAFLLLYWLTLSLFLTFSALLPSFYSFSEPDIGKEGRRSTSSLSLRARKSLRKQRCAGNGEGGRALSLALSWSLSITTSRRKGNRAHSKLISLSRDLCLLGSFSPGKGW